MELCAMIRNCKKIMIAYALFSAVMLDLTFSCVTMFAMQTSLPCKYCSGTGLHCTTCKGTNHCHTCHGSGKHTKKSTGHVVNCFTCHGSGQCSLCHGKVACIRCNGTGVFNTKPGQSCPGNKQSPAQGYFPSQSAVHPGATTISPSHATGLPAISPVPAPAPMPAAVTPQAQTHALCPPVPMWQPTSQLVPAPAPMFPAAMSSAHPYAFIPPAPYWQSTSQSIPMPVPMQPFLQCSRHIVAQKMQEIAQVNQLVALLEQRKWAREHAIEVCENRISQIYASGAPITSQPQEIIMSSMQEIETLKGQLAQINVDHEQARHRAAVLSICLGNMQVLPWKHETELAAEIQRLKDNDQRALTKKILRIMGHMPLLGTSEQITIVGNEGLNYPLTVSRVCVQGINEPIIFIQLPALVQTGGTCGSHAMYNAIQLSMHSFSLGGSLIADRAAVAKLCDALCAEKSVFETYAVIERLKNLRAAEFEDTKAGAGMNFEESLLLFEQLVEKNDHTAAESFKYIHSSSPNAYKFQRLVYSESDKFPFMRFKSTVFSTGKHALMWVGIKHEDLPGGHAVVCKVERLLDGTIGIILVNSGADRDFFIGTQKYHEFVNQIFINDLARQFSIEHGCTKLTQD